MLVTDVDGGCWKIFRVGKASSCFVEHDFAARFAFCRQP
jgi:hypothetical protein